MLSLSSLCTFLVFVAGIQVQGQRISQRKCAEFRKETKLLSTGIALTLDPDPIVFESFNCSKSVDLIVGGEDAKDGEFPHQALLGWKVDRNGTFMNDFKCGGSLISERFVLTAAHCMKYGSPQIVRLGELDLTVESDDEFDVGIEYIRRHPEHRFKYSYHDIALIKLNQSIPFSYYIRPACLWDSIALNVTSVIATGFGNTEFEGEKMSDTLRKVQLDVLSRSECEKQYLGTRNFDAGVQDSQLCIGSVRGGQDACQGDSGGPIQVITEPKGCTYDVLAVTSTGAACGIGRSPSIYTRVASYIDWIEKEVWG